jgi:ankyrin repeat protein/beta-lactamase regulating signal transducer with metallopeptidase domain
VSALVRLAGAPEAWQQPLALIAEVVAKSSLVLAVALALAGALGRRSAASRHLVLALGMAAAVTLPVIALLAPPLDLAVLPASAQPPIADPAPVPRPETSRPAATTALPAAAGRAVATAPGVSAWLGSTVLFLASVSLLSLLYLAVGVALVVRLYRRSTDLADDPAWPNLLEPLRRRLGVRRAVDLRTSSEARVPLTLGLWRPAVIVPVEARAWSAAERRAVLLHELAHVARWDWPVQLMARFACALYWFNPLAWVACRRLLVEAERACDDVVLTGGENGPSYARQLLELATRRRSELPVFGAVAMARRATLSRRVEAILDPGQRRAALRGRQAALLSAATLAALLLLAPAHLVRASAGAPESGPATSADALPGVADLDDTDLDTAVEEAVDAVSDDLDSSFDAALDDALGNTGEDLPRLLQAVYRRDAVETRRLLAAGANPDEGAPNLGTPLIVAAAHGDLETVRALLEGGAAPNLSQIYRDGSTQLPRSPLGAAARGGNPAVVDLLLDAGADANFAPRGDGTPLMIAAASARGPVIERLLAASARVDVALKGDGTALIEAARTGDIHIVRRLLAAHADPNLVVRGDGSPLISAVRQGDPHVVSALLEAGADPDLWVDGDECPLYHAVASGQAEIVRLLLERGADPNAVWPGDGTPLIVASRAGSDEVVDLLMAAGARPDLGVRGDGNALITAAAEGQTDLLRRLLASGADPNAAVRGDGSALIAAAANGHLAAVELLVQSGADVDLVVPGDENPLIQAAGEGNYEVVRYLLDAGADPNVSLKVKRYDGEYEIRSPLLQAERGGHPDVIALLRSRGATR